MTTVTSSPHDHIVSLVNLTCRVRLSNFNLISLSYTKTLIIRIAISVTKILLIIFNYYHNQNIDNSILLIHILHSIWYKFYIS